MFVVVILTYYLMKGGSRREEENVSKYMNVPGTQSRSPIIVVRT